MFEGLKGATFIGHNSIRFTKTFCAIYSTRTCGPSTKRKQAGMVDWTALIWSRQHWPEPSALTFEINDKGRLNRRLESLALNGYAEHNAHDAWGDVRATIHITKDPNGALSYGGSIRFLEPNICSKTLSSATRCGSGERFWKAENNQPYLLRSRQPGVHLFRS